MSEYEKIGKNNQVCVIL